MTPQLCSRTDIQLEHNRGPNVATRAVTNGPGCTGWNPPWRRPMWENSGSETAVTNDILDFKINLYSSKHDLTSGCPDVDT